MNENKIEKVKKITILCTDSKQHDIKLEFNVVEDIPTSILTDFVYKYFPIPKDLTIHTTVDALNIKKV